MTRFAAAIAYSGLQTKPAFRSQMERAKKEFSAHMMGGGCGIIRGMIKSAAKTADGRAADCALASDMLEWNVSEKVY